jgi:hypothetical protein
MLLALGCAAGAAAMARGIWASAAQSAMQGMGQAPGQSNPVTPPEPDPALAESARKAMLEQNQKDIKKNVEKLYQLASELKEQVEKTDSATVLSLALLRKTEEIEKLARQIRDRAKG